MENTTMAMKKYIVNDAQHEARISKFGQTFTIEIQTDNVLKTYTINWTDYEAQKNQLRFSLEETIHEVHFQNSSEKLLAIKGKNFSVSTAPLKQKQDTISPGQLCRETKPLVTSPIAGRVIKTQCTPGDMVLKGACLVVLESMKMENEICAHQAGIIKTLFISDGDLVQQNQPLVEFELKGEQNDSTAQSANAQASI